MNDHSMYKGYFSRLLSLIARRPITPLLIYAHHFGDHLVVLAAVLASGGVAVSSAILPLKTNSLVGQEVAQARVASSDQGEADDDTYNIS